MDVEAAATTEVKSRLAMCNGIRAYIDENDKTPITDGHVDLYTGKTASKKTWKGRVNVQVKGRRTDTVPKRPSFSLTRDELSAHRINSGVILFVVYIDRQLVKHTYYRVLTPFTIDEMLRDKPTNQSLSVPLNNLPSDQTGIRNIVGVALQGRTEHPELGFDESVMERALKITVSSTAALDLTKPLLLDRRTHEFTASVTTLDGQVSPLHGMLQLSPALPASRHVDLEVRTSSVIYRGGEADFISSDKVAITLSSDTLLTLIEQDDYIVHNLKMKLNGTFSEALRTLQFAADYIDSGELLVNGERLQPTPVDPEFRERTHNLLSLYRRLDSLFDKLGVDTEIIDVEVLTDQVVQQLEIAGEHIVDGKSHPGELTSWKLTLLSLGDWRLLLSVATASGGDTIIALDPFEYPPQREFFLPMEVSGEKVVDLVTPYDLIDPVLFGSVLNLRMENLTDFYMRISDRSYAVPLMNKRILTLIRSADEYPARAKAFLEAARSLNERLIKMNGPSDHHLVNRWQIHKRSGCLSSAHLVEIRDLKYRTSSKGDDGGYAVLLACALLLEDAADAKYFVSKMPHDALVEFQSWPIWSFATGVGLDAE